jgi:uncharacterized protein (DUF39 family)
MSKTIENINEKIQNGTAVIVTAEEMIDVVEKNGPEKAARKVDVVTTGTFGPMCSSGIYLNVGHTQPKIKLGGGTALLNGVPAYTGYAAVDLFLGCTAVKHDDPLNDPFPGKFKYGGGHVIHDLVAGEDIQLDATAYGTDCYPNKSLHKKINLKNIKEAVLFNPRNAYQNYNVAVNLSSETIYTYMGVLKPDMGNATYSCAGQLSPLMNDPLYKTIGIGTRIFLGGGVGYVSWWGTQHNPNAPRLDSGVPRSPAGTLALTGDLKQMDEKWLKGVSFVGYGATMAVGVGVPIPILNAEMARYTSVRDRDIPAQVVDYSRNYPQGIPGSVSEVNYEQLRSGSITLEGKTIPTAGFSNYQKARQIAEILKDWMEQGDFTLARPVSPIPGPDPEL